MFSLWQNSAAHMFSLPQVDRCVCLSVSANLAHEQKGAEIQPSPRNLTFLHLPAQLLLKSTQPRKVPIKHPLLSEPSRGTIASHLFRAVQIPCLLYQYSSLWQPHKHRDTIFLPALCEQMNKVQGHSQFLMLSYLVPKFLSSEIRSLCSEVSSWQPLYFFPLFHPFWIILLLC